MKLKLFLSLISLFCSLFLFSQVKTKNLGLEKWTFQQEGKAKILLASVPGTVHTDLFKNKQIPDPYYSDNEQEIQWIENENWIYKTSFRISKPDLQNDAIKLVFEGLDTYADVYLNDQKIISANNMFRTWQKEIKSLLKEGNNSLEIRFESAVKKGKEAAKSLPYELPEGERVFVRKAQYQFGWDWGPRFVTAGIWKPVRLEFIKNAQIESIGHSQKIEKNTAQVTFTTQIQVEKEGNYTLQINETKKNIPLKKGLQTISIPTEIKNPKLWWSKGLGEPHLYSYSIQLIKGNQLLDERKLKIGIRDIKLIEKPDDKGVGFYFELNGVPVYIKGANTIPLHSFLPNVTQKDYQKLIDEAVFANMNMLRVWGGGIYEDDEFYNLCDENGILVWQDFAFACTMYPGDDAFLDNVKQEVIDNAKRLQNHASLAIWCGNNENNEGWHNWGWQKQFKYSEQDSTKIWNDYVKTFRELIPQTLAEVYPEKPLYWQSSPKNGWGREKSYQEGDVHYWGVWWGKEPFEKYEEKTGRFVSEYGFQGMPPIKTLAQISSNLQWGDPGIKNHQKHKTGYETIREYMERDYPIPHQFEDYAYISQLLQARGLEIAVQAHRGKKPFNMGTLYWQLNDVWPVTSWSSIDFYNNRKASHYSAKRLFQDVFAKFKVDEKEISIQINNDLNKDQLIKFDIQIQDLKGKTLYTKRHVRETFAMNVFVLETIARNEIPNYDPTNMLISVDIETSDKKTYEFDYFPAKPKDLKLEKAQVKVERINEKTLKLTSDVVAKDVYVETNKISNFDDNFFTLIPGKAKIITAQEPISDFKIKTLNEYVIKK